MYGGQILLLGDKLLLKLAPSQLVGPSLTFHNTPTLSFFLRPHITFLHISPSFLQTPTVRSLCGQRSPARNIIHPSDYSSLRRYTMLYCFPTTFHLQEVFQLPQEPWIFHTYVDTKSDVFMESGTALRIKKRNKFKTLFNIYSSVRYIHGIMFCLMGTKPLLGIASAIL